MGRSKLPTRTTGSPTTEVNLHDIGDRYGERITLVDLNFQKNIRFMNKRLSFGVNIYNLFNSDAITGYEGDYTAFRLANGTWVTDDPTTPAVQEWMDPTTIVNPRFMRFTVSMQF